MTGQTHYESWPNTSSEETFRANEQDGCFKDLGGGAFNCLHGLRILMAVKAMKSLLKRLVGALRAFCFES